MKYKTLIEKNFETILTEGRHPETPPCDPCARTEPAPRSSPRFPRLHYKNLYIGTL